MFVFERVSEKPDQRVSFKKMPFCEVKSLTIYHNSTSSSVYLTLQDISSRKVFAGKIKYEKLPEYLLDTYLIVETSGDAIGKQKFSERKGNNFVNTEIDQFEILVLDPFRSCKIKCDSTMEK